MSQSSGIPLEELRPHMFLLRDRDATGHLMRCALALLLPSWGRHLSPRRPNALQACTCMLWSASVHCAEPSHGRDLVQQLQQQWSVGCCCQAGNACEDLRREP